MTLHPKRCYTHGPYKRASTVDAKMTQKSSNILAIVSILPPPRSDPGRSYFRQGERETPRKKGFDVFPSDGKKGVSMKKGERVARFPALKSYSLFFTFPLYTWQPCLIEDAAFARLSISEAGRDSSFFECEGP